MGLTKINFNDIQNTSETEDVININDSVLLKQEVIIPTKPPTKNQFDGAIWVDPSSNNVKVKINSVTYDLSPQTDFNNISINAPFTFPLNGNVGIVNNLTIGGTGTTVNFRSSSIGGAQWSVLEVKGNLNIASGCTLNLIRTPLIVRGSILGSGIITSPNGANGGAGGVGGPGGTGGTAGANSTIAGAGGNGNLAPITWSGRSGSSGGSMDIEYGLSAAIGGDGGIGTAGGGGGGGVVKNPNTTVAWNGGASGNGFAGGTSTSASTGSPNGFLFSGAGAGGGGAGGVGGNAIVTSPQGTFVPQVSGGPGSTGTAGSVGGSVSSYPNNYVGISNSSPGGSGLNGTLGGSGGSGAVNIYNSTQLNALNGGTGGTGGAGGAGGSTGGANISILSVGPISSTLIIRPGKGGLNGGNVSFARAQTGNLYLFTPNGNESVPGIDLTGAPGTPTGPSGTLNRVALSNASGVSDFYTTILYEASGPSAAKNKIAITYP